jgi:outer membrane protein assembly factor BamB
MPRLPLLAALLALPAVAADWPQWRGPNGDGVSAETGLPLRWSESSGVLWKQPLEGPGSSSPVVSAGAVFVTEQDGDDLFLLKFDAVTGRPAWKEKVGSGDTPRAPIGKKSADERKHQKFHPLQNLATPTPAADGDVVVAHFGDGELAAYDFAGKRLWRRNLQDDYGPYTIWWGHANSPILYKDFVICTCIQDSLSDVPGGESESYLLALDKRSGERKWRTVRKTKSQAEEGDAYTTPVWFTPAGRGRETTPQPKRELVVMGGNQLDAYDPDDGHQLWHLPGLVGGRTVGGPTVGDGMVFATRGKKGPLLAVRPEGEGEQTEKAVVWSADKNTPDSCSPVYWKGLLFTVEDENFAVCYDARTGDVKWKERLNAPFKASPVAADGRLYLLSRTGACTVLAASDNFDKLATNELDGGETNASPAVADGRIYIRTSKALYCIGAK